MLFKFTFDDGIGDYIFDTAKSYLTNNDLAETPIQTLSQLYYLTNTVRGDDGTEDRNKFAGFFTR